VRRDYKIDLCLSITFTARLVVGGDWWSSVVGGDGQLMLAMAPGVSL